MEIFEGNFDSLETALKEQRFRNTNDVFTSDNWKNRQQLFLDMSKEGISPRHSSLISFLAEHKQIDTILDIGGGSGWIFNLLEANIQKPLTYINLEITEICEEFSKKFSHTNRVQFVDSWESILSLKEISLIYSNSTIQYMSDENLFENFRKISQPKYLVLDDFIATSSKSYWTLQNYYGSFIPYYFRNLTEFNENLFAQGYSVISAEDYRQTLSPGYSYGEEKMPMTVVYQLDK